MDYSLCEPDSLYARPDFARDVVKVPGAACRGNGPQKTLEPNFQGMGDEIQLSNPTGPNTPAETTELPPMACMMA